MAEDNAPLIAALTEYFEENDDSGLRDRFRKLAKRNGIADPTPEDIAKTADAFVERHKDVLAKPDENAFLANCSRQELDTILPEIAASGISRRGFLGQALVLTGTGVLTLAGFYYGKEGLKAGSEGLSGYASETKNTGPYEKEGHRLNMWRGAANLAFAIICFTGGIAGLASAFNQHMADQDPPLGAHDKLIAMLTETDAMLATVKSRSAANKGGRD